MKNHIREWKALATAALAGRDEWLLPTKSTVIEVHAPARPSSLSVCVTKQLVGRELIRILGKHRPITVIVCPVLPARWHCGIIRYVVNQGEGNLRFVGDLDPLDLGIYLCLQRGGNDTNSHPRTRVPVQWSGVCGQWLSESVRHLREEHLGPLGRAIESLEQPMSAFEERATSVLMRIAPNLFREIDQQSVDVLRRNHKVEVDSLLNDALYITSHRKARIAFLERLVLGECQDRAVTGHEKSQE